MEFSVLIWRMFHIINLTSPETIQRTRSLCHLCFFFNENNPCWYLSMGSLQSELFTLKRSTLNAREWRSFSQRVKFCYQQAFQIDYNRSFFPVTTLRLRGVGLVVQCSIPLTGYEAGLQCAGETTQVWDDVFWHIFKTKKKRRTNLQLHQSKPVYNFSLKQYPPFRSDRPCENLRQPFNCFVW